MREDFIRLLTSTAKVKSNKDLEVKLAEDREEYEKAFKLLHDAYVAKGLMEKHPSGLRCNIHSFLPHNTVIIVKDKKLNEVIGTVSLILDNLLGLPAEKAFPVEVSKIRKIKQNKMVEVSALAIDPKYRHQSHSVQFMLNKFLYTYCKNNLGVDMLVIVVHPKAEIFYKALMGFKSMGKIIEYNFVRGALGRLLYLDFSRNFEKKLEQKYLKIKNSFFEYVVYENDKRLRFDLYPQNKILTRNKFTMVWLMNQSKFDFDRLTDVEKKQLESGLNHDFHIEKLRKEIDYRFEVNLPANLTINSAFFSSKILNLSMRGAFIQSPNIFWEIGSLGRLDFVINGRKQSISFVVRWNNEGTNSKLPPGIGVEFPFEQIDLFNKKIA